MYGRTYDDNRFSPLDQINERTVSKLGLAWSRELGTTRGLEATPLVNNGVLYTTSAWSVVYAINAKTGAILWTYDPKVPRERSLFYCCDAVNRGPALYRGKVYFASLDGRLIGINTMTSDKRFAEGLSFSIAFPTLLELVPDRLEIPRKNPESGKTKK